MKKNKKKKGRNKEESAGQKKLGFVTPISMTLVQLPQTVVLTFSEICSDCPQFSIGWIINWLTMDLLLVACGMWQGFNLLAEQ